jgi:hypothetical protein
VPGEVKRAPRPKGNTGACNDRAQARWKLGQLLAKIERGHEPGRGKKILTPLNEHGPYLCQRLGAALVFCGVVQDAGRRWPD